MKFRHRLGEVHPVDAPRSRHHLALVLTWGLPQVYAGQTVSPPLLWLTLLLQEK